MLMTYLLVAVGGALGSMARFWVSDLVAHRIGETFPWGTIIINITGSFLIGLFAGLMRPPSGRWLATSNTRVFFTYGICGGYTTFSSFSLQTLDLLREGEWLHAGANVVLSVVLCMIAVWLGYALAMTLNKLMKGA
jgi:CrcB protein